jgi:hypothetical protein
MAQNAEDYGYKRHNRGAQIRCLRGPMQNSGNPSAMALVRLRNSRTFSSSL